MRCAGEAAGSPSSDSLRRNGAGLDPGDDGSLRIPRDTIRFQNVLSGRVRPLGYLRGSAPRTGQAGKNQIFDREQGSPVAALDAKNWRLRSLLEREIQQRVA